MIYIHSELRIESLTLAASSRLQLPSVSSVSPTLFFFLILFFATFADLGPVSDSASLAPTASLFACSRGYAPLSASNALGLLAPILGRLQPTG